MGWSNATMVLAVGEMGVTGVRLVLARYIGAFGKPQNVHQGGSEAIAMTAPVLVTPPSPQKIAMTAPVLVTPSESHTMAFVLPASKYSSVEDAPKPTDPGSRCANFPSESRLFAPSPGTSS